MEHGGVERAQNRTADEVTGIIYAVGAEGRAAPGVFE